MSTTQGPQIAGLRSPSSGSQLEVDAWMPSEISAISPLVDRLLRLLEGAHCVPGDARDVQLALREALNNAVLHGNRQDPNKKVHVRCRCWPAHGLTLIVKDEGQGFDPGQVPNPTDARHVFSEIGRGIYLIKLYMDEVHFEQGGREVHLSKSYPQHRRD